MVVSAELVEKNLLKPALLFLVRHGEIALGLVMILLRLFLDNLDIGSIFRVVDFVLLLGGGRSLVFLDPRPA